MGSTRHLLKSLGSGALSGLLRNCCAPVKGPMSGAAYARPMSGGVAAAPLDSTLNSLDPTQVSLLEEPCILVDQDDKVIGSKSKKECHLMTNIRNGMLHRAFSVFLFNSKGELLVQQRSDEKITFPGCFTNTCCSHPLSTPAEQTADPVEGVKRAAQRRMRIELGISPHELPLDSFHYLTRIHYLAPSNGQWGEHEIDYILFCQRDIANLQPNPNEIKSWRYVSRSEVKNFLTQLEAAGEPLTPWFSLILDSFLLPWWDNLGNLKQFEDHDTIHRLSNPAA